MPKVKKVKPPTALLVRRERERLGMTPGEAGEIVYVAARTWQQWESSIPGDHRQMSAGMWELFLLKTEEQRARLK